MAGVFYIYLVVKYIEIKSKFLLSFIISVLLFIFMLPLSFFFFDKISYIQLLSPFLTMLFSIFYPVSIFLHSIGQGDLLDFILKFLFDLENSFWSAFVNVYLFALYIGLSLLSAIRKEIFYLFSLLSFGMFIGFYI
jgi:competence protein ComEC